ncbi:hypothetical protein H9P43_007822 [Blastocladiella emersonii ATCC 22665]|nr:hypothetical protein H9P43_007822 [Blastocladiella emersonii ATCC 22665]
MSSSHPPPPPPPDSADALWGTARALFLKIDDAHAAKDAALQDAAALHASLVEHPRDDPDLDKWEQLVAAYRASLACVRDEITHLEATQDTIGKLYLAVYPDSAHAQAILAARRGAAAGGGDRAAAKNTSKKLQADTKRAQPKFPPIQFGINSNVTVRARIVDDMGVVTYPWIWAIVRDVRDGFYEVEDVEDKRNLNVTEEDIIPLPPSNYPEFPVGSIVMACYPETTAFYKGIVVATPKKVGNYHIQFEDDDGTPYRVIPKNSVTQYLPEKIDRRP